MYQGKKRIDKQIRVKSTKTLSSPKIHMPLPERGYVKIGNIHGSYPYVDNIHEIVSSEFERRPIGSKQKAKRRVKIISNILKGSGFNLLNEIGDEIIGRH